MKFETVEQLEAHIEAHEELLDKAESLLDMKAKLMGLRGGVQREDIIFENYRVEGTHEDYRCGESDYTTVTLDLADLFDPEVETKMKADIAEMKRKKEIAQKQREAQAARRNAEARRAQYEKLKKEFEEG